MDSLAARVAPELDRLRLAISKHLTPRVVAVVGTYGVGETGGYLLAMLRHTMPHRVVARSAVAEIFLYGQAARFESGLTELTDAGLIEHVDGDRLTLSSEGQAALQRYHTINAEVMEALWQQHQELTTLLFELTSRCLRATTDGGATFSVMWPIYVLPEASQATQFAEHLTALRFHRFDAHTAAWRSAGLSVEDVMALADDDPSRESIEDETNRRAATPYSVLDVDEGEALVNGLASLPA